jgi:hypothetical protein
MSLEFHLGVWDPEEALKRGEPASITFNLAGLTVEQANAALPFLRKFTERLEAFITKEDPMGFQKTGDGSKDGKILPEPGDDQKTAAANFTDEDRKALVEENADVLGDG